MVRVIDVDFVGEVGGVMVGVGGGWVSRVQLTVVLEVLPAGSVAVTTRV
jgi:hypothetical protein